MDKRRGDILIEGLTRKLARGSSRRGLMARLGGMLVSATALPLLPVSRAEARTRTAPAPPTREQLTDFERNAQTSDPNKCNYWRHCAIDGSLCGCCGGGVHTCPPGTEPSPTAWIGTCRNPDDGRSYLIAYRDCCGRTGCAADPDCFCLSTDRELPIYRPQVNNDIIWCFGTSSMIYHCSTSVLVGVAE